MKKNFKSIKAAMIMGILLFSVFVAVTPRASAGTFVNLSSYLRVDWAENATGTPIVPRGEMRPLTLNIAYGVTSGGLFRLFTSFLLSTYIGRQVNIKLELVDWSPWCTPGLVQGTITTSVQSIEQSDLTAKLNIRVNEEAPAYGGGFIKIKASVPKIGLIEAYENEFTLEFNPAYLPLIKAELPETNAKKIGPMDTAVFPIEVENLGNARTKVYFEVVGVPDGWIAVVTDDITLDEGVGSKGTAYLTVRPPKGFGYHDEDTSIRVQMIPARAEDTSDRGDPEYITVVVESRGFSAIGIEIVLIPIIIIVLILVLLYYFWIKRRK